MLRVVSSRIFWGVILVVGGVLLLLDTFNVFKGGSLLWTVLSALAGILFISIYVNNRLHWWALIPGVIFLAIAALIGLNGYVPGFSNTSWSSVIILGGIGLSFMLVYLVEHQNWWAIIPAGIMATLATVSVLDRTFSGAGSGGIFFLGLGITFALVAILPTRTGRMHWPWIPAAILGVFGIIILLSAEATINYVWPAALVLIGAFLIIRSIVRKN